MLPVIRSEIAKDFKNQMVKNYHENTIPWPVVRGNYLLIIVRKELSYQPELVPTGAKIYKSVYITVVRESLLT